jgi:outer membrane protein assembly factor BamB
MLHRRILLAALLLLVGAGIAHAVITALTPLDSVLKDAKYICMATVETVDGTKPAAVFVVDDDLKGKFPVRRLLINMTGDAEAKKGDHTAQILKRLAPKLPVVLFATEIDKKYVLFAYTNGTWFQLAGDKPAEGDKGVFAFTHGEPFLRRTFKGTTDEMKKVLVDGLAGKGKLPKVDPKEPPGFGPEVEEKKEAAEPTAFGGKEHKPAQLQADKNWSHLLLDHGNGFLMSRPCIDGKLAYVTSAHGAIARYGAITCLDIESKKTVWSFTGERTMKQGYSSPVLADGKLYFGEGLHEDQDCKLYCLDAKSGKKLWEFATKSHTEATPLVAGGRVYFGAGDDGIYCVDAANGKKLWQFTGDKHMLHLHIDSTPALVGKRLYCGSAVDEDTGEGDPCVFCLDADTGKRHWLHHTPKWTHKLDDKQKTPRRVAAWASPVVLDGVVYFGVGNGRVNAASNAYEPAGGVLALDEKNDSEVWPPYKVGDGVLKQPAVDKEAVYFGCRDGHCYCLERGTGKLRWKADMGSAVIASPVLALDRKGLAVSVFVVGSEGKIACLDPRTGKADWTFADLEKSAPLLVATPVLLVTETAKGQERRLVLGASFNGLATPGVYCVQDFLPAE